MFEFISKDEGNFLPQNKHSLGICTAYEYTQLRLPDKDPAITGLVVCNILDASAIEVYTDTVSGFLQEIYPCSLSYLCMHNYHFSIHM